MSLYPISYRTTNVAVFEGKKSPNDIINSGTMSDDEVVASDVIMYPAVLVFFSFSFSSFFYFLFSLISFFGIFTSILSLILCPLSQDLFEIHFFFLGVSLFSQNVIKQLKYTWTKSIVSELPRSFD